MQLRKLAHVHIEESFDSLLLPMTHTVNDTNCSKDTVSRDASLSNTRTHLNDDSNSQDHL